MSSKTILATAAAIAIAFSTLSFSVSDASAATTCKSGTHLVKSTTNGKTVEKCVKNK